MWKCENMKLRKCGEWGNAKMRGVFFAAVAFSAFLAFADTIDLRCRDDVCKVDVEHGARIVSWTVCGKEMLWNPPVPQKNDALSAPSDVLRFASHAKSIIGTSEKKRCSFALMTLAIHGVMTAPPRIAITMPGPPSLKHFASSPPSAMP